MSQPVQIFLLLFGAYLLGAVPFSVIIGYAFAGVDVRQHGSGNAGATNVYRVAGLGAALIAGLLDVLKGVIPVLVARLLFPDQEWTWYAAALSAVLGHIFPVFAGFRGGKGVNTLLGALVMLMPLEVGIAFGVFAVAFTIRRVISLGSIMAAVTLSVIAIIEKLVLAKNISTLRLSACIGVTLLILFTHRANIRRLLKGEEQRLSR